MAVPKRRKSKSKVRTKRAHHALTPKKLTKCGNCETYKPQHRVCPSCGYYKGVLVLKPKPPKIKATEE